MSDTLTGSVCVRCERHLPTERAALVRAAEDVFDAALLVAREYSLIWAYVTSPREGEIDWRDPEMIARASGDLRGSADVLGVWYTRISGWWVSDRPPDFAPWASSVVEGVLVVALRLLECLKLMPGEPVLVAINCIKAHAPDLHFDEVKSALRCEAVAMTRRTPVWVDCFDTPGTLDEVKEEVQEWAEWVLERPMNWASIAQDEKVAWARSLLGDDPREPDRGRGNRERPKIGAFADEVERDKKIPDVELVAQVLERFGKKLAAESIRKYAREHRNRRSSR